MIPIKGVLINDEGNLLRNEVVIELKDSTGNVTKTITFPVIIRGKPRSAVSLYNPDETITLYDKTEPIQLPLRLVHNQTKESSYYVDITSVPDDINRAALPLKVTLTAKQDTTLFIRLNPLRHWSTNTGYELIATIRDEQKAIVGNVLYKVIVATTTKQYVYNDFYANRDYLTDRGFGAAAAVTKLSTGQWAREGRVWGSDSVGNTQMDFQIHYLDYASQNYRQLQNSFISFRTNKAMARLGSSYDYHEMALFGQGLKATISQPGQQWTVWAINTNPNWLSPAENAWSGNVLSIRYDHESGSHPGNSWSLSSNYFNQSATNRAGYLNFASLRFSRSERHSLEVLAGHSIEYSRTGINRALMHGWAGQLNYAYQTPKFSWQLRSYVSNPVYAGWQRGAKLVSSQAVWFPTLNTTLLLRFNHIGFDPIRFVNLTDSYQSNFSNSQAEISLSQRVKSFTLNLRPYWLYQTDLSTSSVQQAEAYRVSPGLLFQGANAQRFEFRYDVGTFADRTIGGQPTLISHRLVSSIAIGHFSFWGYWQKGPYYLSDLRANQPDQVMTASLMPMLNFSLLNRRLNGSAGLNYTYDALYSGGRCISVGRVQYDASPTLSVRLEGNATPYSERNELAFSQYRMEFIKRFHHARHKQGRHLQLSFFEDINGNGSKDAKERWMDSLLVTVNDNVLFTDAKGTITYKDLPAGTYNISAISTGRVGDPMQFHENIAISRSVKRVVPLARTFRIRGQLHCKTNSYDNQPCQYHRFTVDIQRDEKIISSTSLLPDGSFAVHLSPGNYTLFIRDYGRQTQTTVKAIPFAVNETGQYPILEWDVDGSTRSVDVKRFTSAK